MFTEKERKRIAENPGKCPHMNCKNKVICSADSPMFDSVFESGSCFEQELGEQ
jgi:hypothetical protein